jgi:uncharacterized protein (TIGR03000 family)
MYSIVLMAALTTGGDMPDWGRRGCHGCWGGCYCSCYGCYGCWGCWGCCGCWGGYVSWGCYGGCYGCWGGYAYSPYHPTVTYYASAPALATSSPAVYGLAQAPDWRRAQLVVNLPADAKLTIEGMPTTQTSSRRVFTSPPLEPGTPYYYTLKAEVVRNGQRMVATRDVTVRAGQTTTVTLDIPTEAVSTRP